jgi:hypothetical protein
VYAKLRHGEDIRLIGNIPSLGCNDINRAIVLVTTPRDYPWWWNLEGNYFWLIHISVLNLAIFVPDIVENVTYHYAIFSGGQFAQYEGKNRLLRSILLENTDLPIKSISDIFKAAPSTSLLQDECVGALSDLSCERRRILLSDPNTSDKNSCTLSSTDGFIVVSYFLPVIVTKSADRGWIVQWNDEALLSRTSSLRVSWIGSIPRKFSFTPEDEEIISALLLKLSCYPIYLSREAHRKFYNIFCKEHLWPVLHHSYDPYGPIDKKKLDHEHERMLWYVCTKIQELFSRKVIEIYQKGDIIWIHGFHFMLLPSYLRRKISDALIGIFFHTPFPSSEIWKTLWCREDLLSGMLCANQIGFHLYEYARHFLTTCRRLLGAHYEYSAVSGSLTIQTGGRIVFVTCFHVGTNNCLIENTLETDTFLTCSASQFEKHSGKIVISSKSLLSINSPHTQTHLS